MYEEDPIKPNNSRCKHSLLGIVPIVALRIEGGFASRCLLCDSVGPAMENAERARLALLGGQVDAIHRASSTSPSLKQEPRGARTQPRRDKDLPH